MDDRDFRLKLLTLPVVAGAAIVAFSFPPLLRFANPIALCVGGSLLAGGVAYWLFSLTQGWSIWWVWFAHLLLIVGLGILGFTLSNAAYTAESNDVVCSDLQSKMVKRPSSDRAAVFQALNCRPQRP